MRKWKPVKDFDSDSQAADEKYDPLYRKQSVEGAGILAVGRGQQGGTSQFTPQISQTTTGNKRGGSYKIGNSSPKSPQKLRG